MSIELPLGTSRAAILYLIHPTLNANDLDSF